MEAESDDVEDDFLEMTGIDRVIQALHAHTWSNLQMIGNAHAIEIFFSAVKLKILFEKF